MSALVVDTSSWVDYLAGRPNDALESALADGRVWLPPIVAAELLSGRMSPHQRRELGSLLAELPLCECPFNHWARVGELRTRLAAAGLTVSTPDAHVAQCALDLGGQLMSADRVFTRVSATHPELKVCHWKPFPHSECRGARRELPDLR